MLPEATLRRPLGDLLASRFPSHWRPALVPFSAAGLMVLLAFATDWARIAAIAWESSTFNHILLIPPILIWMVAQRADELLKLTPQAWWPGMIFSAGGAMLWLLGTLSGLDLASQLGAVTVLVSLVPLFLGVRVCAALAFPLCYAFLLVPMGEGLVPALQLLTAKITVSLVEASGIPAHIDGVFIDTPAGLFEVAEACSGVKFLIAMVALGLLVANICFQSWRRRALFMAACVAVPILANGVRAFATVWIAQSIGAERAVGFDHIVYGWFFFAIILALLLAGAWRFFDRAAGAPMADANRISSSLLLGKLEVYGVAALPALAGLILMIGAVNVWARAADALKADLPPVTDLPAVKGWQAARVPAGAYPWRPVAEGADMRFLRHYRDTEGHRVDVFLAVYASQGDGREPGGFGQGAMPHDAGWSWHSPGPGFPDGKSELLRADDGTIRLAATWYVSGPLVTGSNMRLKLLSMADKLLLREKPTAMLIVASAGPSPERAREAVAAYVRDAGAPRRWMDRIGITE